jgi:hypothetical protein
MLTEIRQLFIVGSWVQTGTGKRYRNPIPGFNFVSIWSDPMLIILSETERPLNLVNMASMLSRKLYINLVLSSWSTQLNQSLQIVLGRRD